ncbi:CocE/NonD family hydrolase [Caulobacter sp. RHG1]|uniref:CocE/NonD family hydrolase n=1 Tax=Caulobacter sp. (strain RHG1) TaxID=2545762 RepID=UPI001556A6EC|nr:CocE/NonD family hydrolase [Caulobacter sp. RHG1]NQE60670.1 Glutaryl-7-ACA acylase [Caulobacter sp. RHG1]
MSLVSTLRAGLLAASAVTIFAGVAVAQVTAMTPDIDGKYVATKVNQDYEKRVVMTPMRDGTKLYTVIVIPKGGKNLPILLTRTPYNAAKRAARADSPKMLGLLAQGDEVFVADHDYIRVFQDIRGKYGSEGDYVMTRPLKGPLNSSEVDHSTDAYDTIDWLVKNVPETNGKVGMLGSSYEGFTVVMALVNPHPALKAAAPMSPMVDGWMGDDWFQHGAFRQNNFDYFAGQTSVRGAGDGVQRQGYDDYANFLREGSAGDYAKNHGLDKLPWVQKLFAHTAYDSFWSEQALDKTMEKTPLKVPTMWIQGLWDQEDIWGAVHAYPALESKDKNNDMNYLVLGPWRHSQVNYDGYNLGPFKWDGDTALQFRRDVLKPFFDQHLKDSAKADTPPVLIYDPGQNKWNRYTSWPQSKATKNLYLEPKGGLSFNAPAAAKGAGAYDEYVSDPAKPVPYIARPLQFSDRSRWTPWLVSDQRTVDGRPDVLTYVTEPLTEPLKIAGVPKVNLTASTSGSDSDWVVKLIDVYPDEVTSQPELGGYELPVGMTIFRGRYRESFSAPKALTPNKPLKYQFILPTANYTFQPGHRIMVQVQSSWFPLYDRNPQTFVPNIFFAKPEDYVKATQRVFHAGDTASFIELPVVDAK